MPAILALWGPWSGLGVNRHDVRLANVVRSCLFLILLFIDRRRR